MKAEPERITASAPSWGGGRRAGFAVGIGAVALCELLCIQKNSATLFFTWPWIFYGQLLLLMPVLVLGLFSWMRGTFLTKAESALFAFAVGTVVLTTCLSRHPSSSLESALFLFFGLALCALTTTALRSSGMLADEKKLLRHARIFGGLISLPLLAGLFGWIGYLRDIAPSYGGLRQIFATSVGFRNPRPFGHWNYTGGYALLCVPWFAALVFCDRGRWKLLWSFAAALGLLLLISSSSRGAALGLMVAGATAVIFLAVTRKLRARSLALAGALILIAAAMLIGTNPRLRALVHSPSTLFQPNEGDVQRIAMLKGGWYLVRQSPWLGHGAGMTPFVFPSVRNELAGGVETVYQLHNTPLQIFTDHGMLGIAALVFGLGLLICRSREWLRATPGKAQIFALAAAATLLGFAAMSTTDYQLSVIGIVAVLALLSGLVLATPKANASPSQAKGTGAILMACALVTAVVMIPSWRARCSYWEAWSEDFSKPDLAALERTVSLAPKNVYYLNQLGIQLAEAAATENSPVKASALRQRAVALVTRSLEIEPLQEPVWTSLAWLRLSEAPTEAENDFRQSLALLPDRDTLHFGLALSLLAQQKTKAAVNSLAMECLVSPQFLVSPFWLEEPFKSLRPACLARLVSDYKRCIADVRLTKWQRQQQEAALAFTLWWINSAQIPADGDLQGATQDQAQFFRWLGSSNRNALPQSATAWVPLEQARRNPEHAREILQNAPRPLEEPAIENALVRLRAKPSDIVELLTMPPPGNAGIVQQKINRGHYAVIFGYLDGPGYDDLAPRLLDPFVQQFVAPLLPPRPALPGAVLETLLAAP